MALHDRTYRGHDRATRQRRLPLSGPTVAAGYAGTLVDFAQRCGVSRHALLQASGITPESLADHDARIPFERYVALMRAAKAMTGDPALALRFGAAVDLSDISILGLICLASETMLDAFAQMNRYGQLVVEAANADGGERFSLRREAGALWLVDNRVIPPDFPELVETSFALMVSGTRRFGDTPFVREVQLSYPDPGYADVYQDIFRAPVRFGMGWNAMRVDEAWLSHTIAEQPRYVFGVLTAHAERMLARIGQGQSLRARVETAILPVLHTGTVSAEAVAGQLGISRQTLYRRLKGEGTSFEQVLDALRHQLALHYLAGRKVSVKETAYLLGFSDPAAFSRAFKRWTGEPPSVMKG
jgi:AraC-like DNA-binding protein